MSHVLRAIALASGLVTLAGGLAGCASRTGTSPGSTASASSRGAAPKGTLLLGFVAKGIPDSSKPEQVALRGLTSATLRSLAQESPAAMDWSQWFTVHVASTAAASSGERPPILGRYAVEEDRVTFTPQFPFEAGLTYRALVDTSRYPGSTRLPLGRLESSVTLPARSKSPTTVVEHVYPSIDTLPENLLKFYIHFSGPMSRGHVYDYIRLLNARGKPVDLPFLEIDEELWNPAMTRLTVFIDPGRIKRGVKPLEDIGPAIEAGESYTLEVAPAWQDASGAPLKAGFRKPFKVGAPERAPLDPATWIITPPAADTLNPLAVRFPKPLDHGLASRVLLVYELQSGHVPGTVRLSDHERLWEFTPSAAWKRGRYQVVTQTLLEDLAGNSIGKSFEVDVFDNVQPKLQPQSIALDFRIASP